MNKLLTTIIFFVCMVSFSWGDDELCQIVDINGAVVYTGVCRYSGRDINTNGKISLNGVYVLKSTRSRASHLIRVNDNEIKNIKERVESEIECFVHGAMCYCYPGQC